MLGRLMNSIGLTTPAETPDETTEEAGDSGNKQDSEFEYDSDSPPSIPNTPIRPATPKVPENILLSPIVTKKYSPTKIRTMLCTLIMSSYRQNERRKTILNDVKGILEDLEDYMPHNPELGTASPLRSPPESMTVDICEFIATLDKAINLPSTLTFNSINVRENTPDSPLKRKSEMMASDLNQDEEYEEENEEEDDKSSTMFSASVSGNFSMYSS